MEMAEEEHQHRRWLTDLYQKKFGDFIPLIRRGDIQGFVRHKPAWTIGKMNIEEMRQRAEVIELENYRFYKQAAERSSDPQVQASCCSISPRPRRVTSRWPSNSALST